MSILDEIVARTARSLRDRRSTVSEGDLRRMPLFDEERRPFRESLTRDGISIIAEIKKASPSKGVFRSELVVSEIASQYEAAGAAAISILTEPHFFLGSLHHLSDARAAVSLPLLRKDFLIDTYQIVEARAFGADAVLLIATCVGRSQLDEMLHACDEVGLDHIVEVYSMKDLEKVNFDRAGVLGINCRDLHTFEVDLDGFASILSEVPNGIVSVAESGITDGGALRRVADAGADAVLIGELFMRAMHPGDALRSLVTSAGFMEENAAQREGR